ncbi:TonB-dependent receptor [Marinimicrobium agarilyticum]|uniref:TonB-dependent receptor n=1 Tax=Marinimicrobium agarilyticum TaxID=306546 RepID=UPI00040DC476|nr:TonB-dependent receptor [Marinimicrobium agarilyticum]
MSHETSFRKTPLAVALTAAMALSGTANAQTSETANPGIEEIQVTGFRASLNTALNQKRESTAAVDSIVAEDIGKFPDSNLAESMQRIPGVTLSRGDGGEGKNISVRGLGPEFTRVRINGMEGTSQTGSSDIYGAGNAGRSFDFNVFPTEIFSELTVRKTPSANIEEGSLGATVDLRAPKPLSTEDDLTMTGTVRGVYNQVGDSVDPRFSGLISKKFADGTFGVLAAVAHSERNIREVGYSAVNILPTYVNGGFCSPVGYTPQNPEDSALKGTDALNCATNNPRTGSAEAYELIQSSTGVSGNPGGGIFLPRIPRYLNSEQDAERSGGVLTLEWQPTPDTNIALDNLYSRYDVVRRDNYIDALSFARNANVNGQPMVSVRELEVNADGSLEYGVFDGVNLRSESLVDRFTSTFEQTSLSFSHVFNENWEASALLGRSESEFDNPERLTVNLDSPNTDDFTIDFRGRDNIPAMSYGIDVNDPSNFNYAPRREDGVVLGNYNTRNLTRVTENTTAEANLTWYFSPAFTFKFGMQSRESDYQSHSIQIADEFRDTSELPEGTTVADFTRTIDGVNDILGSGTMGNYVGVDHEKWKSIVGFNDFTWCGAECGAQSPAVIERIDSLYAMTEFNFDSWAYPVRGDFGFRYIDTDQESVGFIPTAAPEDSPYSTVAQRTVVTRQYDDLLPSANVVVEFTPELQGRFSAAKVMSRPNLGLLIPSGSMNPVTRTASVGNPFLEPIRANTFDAALEWYFDEGALASVAYFRKDISTYIQSISSLVPYTELGLPSTLLEGTAANPDDLFTVNRSSNTEGGPLSGVELNLQMPMTFLEGFWQDFGLLANYTHVTSEIDYVLQSEEGVPTLTTTNDLIGLSENSASATLYYENEDFSIRTTGSYRSGYLRAVPSGANDSDVLGNESTLFVDASASYYVTDTIKLIFEAQNLTNERNTLYIDSQRQDPLFETEIGRTFTVGVSATF